jgi:hypothetical protein
MILLNSEKQCIYMYKGRRAAAAYIPLSAVAYISLSAAAATHIPLSAAAAEEEEEVSGCNYD